MMIAVHVATADLRGMSFERYAAVLDNLIGERLPSPLAVDEIAVVRAKRTEVLFDDNPSMWAHAAKILGRGLTPC